MNADAQMDAARDFPQNTCGASRHAQILAESMLSATAQRWSIDEPNHCGESIAATVTALYEARTELRRLDAVNAQLLEALHHISLCSQNSMSSQRQCGEIARAAIAATGETK